MGIAQMDQSILITVPRYPAHLRGDLWGISAYVSPAGYSNKLGHLRLFANRIQTQGLKLLVVELAVEDQPFGLDQKVAAIVVRVRSSTILWEKERLLNIALGTLPGSCDKVIWLETDVLFENENWVEETSQLLEQFVVAQPYDVARWLPRGVECIAPQSDIPSEARPGMAYAQTVNC